MKNIRMSIFSVILCNALLLTPVIALSSCSNSSKVFNLNHYYVHDGLCHPILTVSDNEIQINKNEEYTLQINVKDWTGKQPAREPRWNVKFAKINGDLQKIDPSKVKVEINDKQLEKGKDFKIENNIISGCGVYEKITWSTKIKIVFALIDDGTGKIVSCYPGFSITESQPISMKSFDNTLPALIASKNESITLENNKLFQFIIDTNNWETKQRLEQGIKWKFILLDFATRQPLNLNLNNKLRVEINGKLVKINEAFDVIEGGTAIIGVNDFEKLDYKTKIYIEFEVKNTEQEFVCYPAFLSTEQIQPKTIFQMNNFDNTFNGLVVRNSGQISLDTDKIIQFQINTGNWSKTSRFEKGIRWRLALFNFTTKELLKKLISKKDIRIIVNNRLLLYEKDFTFLDDGSTIIGLGDNEYIDYDSFICIEIKLVDDTGQTQIFCCPAFFHVDPTKVYQLKCFVDAQSWKGLTISEDSVVIQKSKELELQINLDDWIEKQGDKTAWGLVFYDVHGETIPMNESSIRVYINNKKIESNDYAVENNGLIYGIGNYEYIPWDTNIKIIVSLSGKPESSIACYPLLTALSQIPVQVYNVNTYSPTLPSLMSDHVVLKENEICAAMINTKDWTGDISPDGIQWNFALFPSNETYIPSTKFNEDKVSIYVNGVKLLKNRDYKFFNNGYFICGLGDFKYVNKETKILFYITSESQKETSRNSQEGSFCFFNYSSTFNLNHYEKMKFGYECLTLSSPIWLFNLNVCDFNIKWIDWRAIHPEAEACIYQFRFSIYTIKGERIRLNDKADGVEVFIWSREKKRGKDYDIINNEILSPSDISWSMAGDTTIKTSSNEKAAILCYPVFRYVKLA